MSHPVVTVICLCYNHENFVKEAIDSALNQTYPAVQLIVVDDASSDNSAAVIANIVSGRPDILFISHDQNIGNCRSFNEAMKYAKGDYIIDLAADDLLLPQRVEKGVEALKGRSNYGVNYCDATYIDGKSAIIGRHYKRNAQGELLKKPPEGDVYTNILARYFICPPTAMFTRQAVDELGGYDENLAYEDFDFWVRSSRKYFYSFTDAVLVKKRALKGSLSSRQYEPNSKILYSTYLVCEKAYSLNRTKEENEALVKRIKYELRQALLSKNFDTAVKFCGLLKKLGARGFEASFLCWAARRRFDLSFLNYRRLSSSSRILR